MEQKKEMKMIIPRDLICGVCSKIPACCVKYYLENKGKKTCAGRFGNPKVMRLFKKLSEKEKHNSSDWWGYTVCPDCLKKKKVVKILNCREDDDVTLRPGVRCFFRDPGGVLPNWNNEYGPVLWPFLTPYEEGMGVPIGHVLIHYKPIKEGLN